MEPVSDSFHSTHFCGGLPETAKLNYSVVKQIPVGSHAIIVHIRVSSANAQEKQAPQHVGNESGNLVRLADCLTAERNCVQCRSPTMPPTSNSFSDGSASAFGVTGTCSHGRARSFLGRFARSPISRRWKQSAGRPGQPTEPSPSQRSLS